MKRILGFAFVLVAIFCIFLALNRFLDLDSDVLSATSTLFAAFIAIMLFNDWKKEFNHKLVSELQLKYLRQLDQLEDGIHSLLTFLMLFSQKELDNIDEIVGDQKFIHLKKNLQKIKKMHKIPLIIKNSDMNEYYLLGETSIVSLVKINTHLIEALDYLERSSIQANTSIKDEKIQELINFAIDELRQAEDFYSETYISAADHIFAK